MVPYVSYYTHDQYSLVSTLEAQGYASVAMHPNKGSNWKRTSAYRFLGFDTFYTVDDLILTRSGSGTISAIRLILRRSSRWWKRRRTAMIRCFCLT